MISKNPEWHCSEKSIQFKTTSIEGPPILALKEKEDN